MVRRFYGLPSLTALATFEASARHGNFTLAAAELNVTTGAVSRQIKSIEQELGVALFLRTGKGVMLTAPAEDLYRALATGFARASEVVNSIKQGNSARNVTIACSDVFGTMWLIPRMPDFWRRFTDISVDHLIGDNFKTFRPSQLELRIRYGSGKWIDETAEFLFDDCLYPVCSPGFAEKHAGASAADLADLPLLNVEWVEPGWTGWEEVLARGGVPYHAASGRRFGKFSVALQAAMADQGLVVGWHRLVGPLVEKGDLVRFTDLVVPDPGAYYLTWNSTRALPAAALSLRDWIRMLAEEERRTPMPLAQPFS
ncbi:DNA-binding transcriptional LysR family regulator [Rhizobium leguminosarum]|uniref:DNA-binding transcriptional LysR family regulator n=1 Tax=Rhizobium leguminosarum TaxID=384 RepID=A0A7Z0DYS4_RHILE|nr:LysR substrate-binding domain-containing protein [Rhizobium leguminosarum]NYJ11895.1 DNA-binding transcriptional LysR family regulator [Rhizobium leguminosarum]